MKNVSFSEVDNQVLLSFSASCMTDDIRRSTEGKEGKEARGGQRGGEEEEKEGWDTERREGEYKEGRKERRDTEKRWGSK